MRDTLCLKIEKMPAENSPQPNLEIGFDAAHKNRERGCCSQAAGFLERQNLFHLDELEEMHEA